MSTHMDTKGSSTLVCACETERYFWNVMIIEHTHTAAKSNRCRVSCRTWDNETFACHCSDWNYHQTTNIVQSRLGALVHLVYEDFTFWCIWRAGASTINSNSKWDIKLEITGTHLWLSVSLSWTEKNYAPHCKLFECKMKGLVNRWSLANLSQKEVSMKWMGMLGSDDSLHPSCPASRSCLHWLIFITQHVK